MSGWRRRRQDCGAFVPSKLVRYCICNVFISGDFMCTLVFFYAIGPMLVHVRSYFMATRSVLALDNRDWWLTDVSKVHGFAM